MTTRFHSLPLALGAAFLTFTAMGCPGGPTIEPEPSVLEPEGNEPDVGGESCADATEVTPGTTVNGDTAGGTDAHKGACDAESEDGSAGPDLAYTFTLTERSSVTINLTGAGTYDPILYVSSADTCLADVACSDAVGVEETFLNNLDAGTYYVVVDTYIGPLGEDTRQDDGGAFTLDIVVAGPQCLDDQFDDPATVDPADAASLGALDVDTLDLDPTTPEEDSIDLILCDAADFYLLPHMGGALTVDVTSRDDSPAPAFTLHEAGEDGEGIVIEGAEVAIGDNGRGNYLLKIVDGGASVAEGLNYRIVATHGCLPDANDDIDVALDDATTDFASEFFQNTEAPLERAMCGTDEDGYVIRSLFAGNTVVTLGGGADLGASVATIDDEGNTTAAVLDTDYTVANAGADKVVTLLTVGEFFILVDAGATTAQVAYTFNVNFEALAVPPANDSCGTAGPLAPAEVASSVIGRTFGGTHTIAGPVIDDGEGGLISCNGDGEVVDGSTVGPASEVFYSVNVAAPENIEFKFDGSLTGFNGAMYLLEFTGGVCPTDLATLAPVQIGDAPACEVGQTSRLRVTALAAGDYLLVVDGVYSPELDLGIFVIPESKTEGAFELTTTTYPGGFPPPEACIAPTAVATPVAGTPVVEVIDRSELPVELVGSCGGNGNEKVFEVTPAADVAVTITLGGGGEDYDTVLYVLEAACSEEATELACNDDDGNDPAVGNLGSRVDLALTGGTTYYIVADSYALFDDNETAATLSISVTE